MMPLNFPTARSCRAVAKPDFYESGLLFHRVFMNLIFMNLFFGTNFDVNLFRHVAFLFHRVFTDYFIRFVYHRSRYLERGAEIFRHFGKCHCCVAARGARTARRADASHRRALRRGRGHFGFTGPPRGIQQTLQQLGWTDGRNVRIDYRWGAGGADKHRKYAAELVALAPDVILASGPTVEQVLQASRTVPIVLVIVTDPVGSGFGDSLSRPGGNATGFGRECGSRAWTSTNQAGRWPSGGDAEAGQPTAVAVPKRRPPRQCLSGPES